MMKPKVTVDSLSDTISSELNNIPEFHKQKTFIERSSVCFNSFIGCLYISFCLPCYCCYLNNKCYNQ